MADRGCSRAILGDVTVLLDLADRLPSEPIAAGTTLLREGDQTGTIFLLLEGSLRVEKGGTLVAVIDEPGACVGEMSALLDSPHTADVVAGEPSVVARLDAASAHLGNNPELTLALATLLARRLQLVTSYLADLKRQYEGEDSNLGMLDAVLSSLMRHSGRPTQLGSDRDPDPEY